MITPVPPARPYPGERVHASWASWPRVFHRLHRIGPAVTTLRSGALSLSRRGNCPRYVVSGDLSAAEDLESGTRFRFDHLAGAGWSAGMSSVVVLDSACAVVLSVRPLAGADRERWVAVARHLPGLATTAIGIPRHFGSGAGAVATRVARFLESAVRSGDALRFSCCSAAVDVSGVIDATRVHSGAGRVLVRSASSSAALDLAGFEVASSGRRSLDLTPLAGGQPLSIERVPKLRW